VTDEEPNGEAPFTEGSILTASDDGVATLTLDRPAKLNAIGPAMIAELAGLLAEIDSDRNVRVVIITGTGDRAFSVGADVTAWSALEPLDMWREWIRGGHRVLERLAHLRQPTIAAINGYAFGGGLELALAADIRIAAASETFALPETRIGTLPGWNGTKRLPQAIGAARAKQMIFSGSQIDAVTAERWGLVNEVVALEALMDRCRSLASEIAANAPVSVQLAKAIISGDEAAPEAFAGALAAGTVDGREGIVAFREKRSPRFTGQ
jgi:enoyl-CoA hydratase